MNYPMREIRKLECYTVEELALATNRAVSTVQTWLSDGLPKLDASRPVLIYGSDYLDWARDKRGRKPQCKPEQFRCQCCGTYQIPVGNIIMLTEEAGKPRAMGTCSNCGSEFSQFFSLRSLPLLEGKIEVLRE